MLMPKPTIQRTERRSMPGARACTVCLQGVYVTRMETDSGAGRGELQRFGIDLSERHVEWHVEACNHCGYVQIFRRDWGEASRES